MRYKGFGTIFQKKVSVIIPCYNSVRFVPEAVSSVFNQSYGNIEVIVVDDGSTDGTREALLPHIRHSMIRYFRQDNRGPSAARNTGIRKARGRYIAFLDADDLWTPDKLEKTVRFLEQNGFDWVCTAMLKIRKNGEKVIKSVSASAPWAVEPNGEVHQLKNGLFFFSNVPVHTQSIVSKRENFEKTGLFDESFRISEDTDLWLRFEEAGLRGGYLDEPLTIYRHNDTSITHEKRVDGLNEHVRVARKHVRILGKEKEYVRRSYGDFLWEVARGYIARRRYVKAVRHFAVSVRYNPRIAARVARKLAERLARGGGKDGRLNVLYYDPTSGYGGSSRCLISWLTKLDRNLFNPFVIAHYDGPMMQKAREMDVPVTLLPFRSRWLYPAAPVARSLKLLGYANVAADLATYDLPTALVMARFIRKNRIDVVHLNAKLTSVVGGILASKLAGIPSICTLHDTKVPVKKERIFGRLVDRLVVLTPKAYELYRHVFPGKSLELIPNGVDPSEFRPAANGAGEALRREYGLGPADRIVGIVGRLVEGKGFQDFVRAAKVVTRHFPNTVFMIVGKDPMEGMAYEHSLRSLVGELGLERKVVFAGWREDVRVVMSLFDILVQASSTFPEGFGMTVIEAMALKKPVVVTDIPGPSEIVVDRRTGFIVPPADPGRLAAAIETILGDEALARSFGEEGFRRVTERFDLTLTVRKLETAYRVLAAGGAETPTGIEGNAW